MNLQEQVQFQLIRRREEWENLAVLALSAAFKATPQAEHQDLLDSVYHKIIQRVFADTEGERSGDEVQQ
jgi:hypothetical protein